MPPTKKRVQCFSVSELLGPDTFWQILLQVWALSKHLWRVPRNEGLPIPACSSIESHDHCQHVKPTRVAVTQQCMFLLWSKYLWHTRYNEYVCEVRGPRTRNRLQHSSCFRPTHCPSATTQVFWCMLVVGPFKYNHIWGSVFIFGDCGIQLATKWCTDGATDRRIFYLTLTWGIEAQTVSCCTAAGSFRAFWWILRPWQLGCAVHLKYIILYISYFFNFTNLFALLNLTPVTPVIQ